MDEPVDRSRGSASRLPREQLDVLLVARKLAETREMAQRLIMAGKVQAEGYSNLKPGMKLPPDIVLSVTEPERYVSRGGIKLERALQAFQVSPEGLVCGDFGASTGGFTDCLLQHGARRVYCIDVGVSQLHARIQSDPRVVIIPHCNARNLAPETLPEPLSLAVADLSFISVTKVLEPVKSTLLPGAELIVLVKPQFESTRQEASRGRGIISDPAIHARVLTDLFAYVASIGMHPLALIPSPIAGGSGNREYLLHLATANNTPRAHGINIDAVVAQAFIQKIA